MACIIYPFARGILKKFFWGSKFRIKYRSVATALREHSDVDVMVNFASFRSAYASVQEALEYPQLRVLAIVAEGIPKECQSS